MEIKYVDGCICTSLTVDGKETADMSAEEMKVSIQAMLDREQDCGVLQRIWESLVLSQGEYKYMGRCECCGDSITEYTLKL